MYQILTNPIKNAVQYQLDTTMKDKKVILVVDDEEAILDSLKFILEDEGFTVKTAKDGTQMQTHLNIDIPNLVILDYQLPGMNGTELTKLLKEKRETKNIPVIMVSSHDVKLVSQQVGASDFLEKPFDIETLLETVHKYLPN